MSQFSGIPVSRPANNFGSSNRRVSAAVSSRVTRGGGARKRRKGRVMRRLGADPLKELASTPNVPAIDPMMLIRKRPSRGRR